MRLLADENIPEQLIVALRNDGHDVTSMREIHRSAVDEVVLQQAIDDDRALLTFDSDFGRMIFAENHPAPRGVIYIRTPPPSPDDAIARVLRVANADAPRVDGYFVAIDRKARYHPLPSVTQERVQDE